jgi:serine/threonine-protein kinase
MAELAPGQVVAGYRIETVVGRGGMGVVYRATQLSLDRAVALKAIAPELAGDVMFRERFKRESRIAASIEHPNVIPVYEAGEGDGLLYLTMRYVEGTDLRALIETQGGLAPARAARLLAQVAAALAAAHRRDLMHRDVKPANVLIDASGEREHAYLTDFGIARHVAATSGLTQTGSVVGTLDYLAPERMVDGGGDARADVYALGCVLFQALTGSVPYPRENEVAKMYAHLNAPVPDARDLNAGVPDALAELAMRAMAKEPEARVHSASELAEQLLTAADQVLSTAEPGPDSAGTTLPATPPVPAPPSEPSLPSDRPAPSTEPATPGTEPAAPSAEPAMADTEPAAADTEPATADTEPLTASTETAATGPAADTDPGATVPAATEPAAPEPAATKPLGPRTTGTEGGPSGGLGALRTDVGTKSALPERGGRGAATRGRGPGVFIAAAGAVVALIAVVVVLVSGGSGGSGDESAQKSNESAQKSGKNVRKSKGTGSAATLNPTPLEPIALKPGADGVATGAGFVWIANRELDTVTRVNAQSRQVDGEPIQVGQEPDSLAEGLGAMWVTNTSSNSVTRMDLGTGKPLGNHDVGGAPEGILIARGSAWIANGGDGTVTRLDSGGNRTATAQVGSGPVQLAATSDSVWVTVSKENKIVELDVASGQPTGREVPISGTPRGIAYDPRRKELWVSASAADQLAVVDAAEAKVVDRVKVPDNPREVRYGLGAIWLTSATAQRVTAVDQAKRRVIKSVSIQGTTYGLAVGEGLVWAASESDGLLLPIRPR